MGDTELKLLIGLHRTINKIDRKTVQMLKKHGLSLGQFAVLEALYHKGDMSVGMVQEKILSTSGTIPVIINNLEKRGLVMRLTDSSDRRKSILHITAEGERLIEVVFPENRDLIIESMEIWTDEEKEELLRLLKKIRR